jgi:hypothetical protein
MHLHTTLAHWFDDEPAFLRGLVLPPVHTLECDTDLPCMLSLLQAVTLWGPCRPFHTQFPTALFYTRLYIMQSNVTDFVMCRPSHFGGSSPFSYSKPGYRSSSMLLPFAGGMMAGTALYSLSSNSKAYCNGFSVQCEEWGSCSASMAAWPVLLLAAWHPQH